jgi:hypothetical protein
MMWLSRTLLLVLVCVAGGLLSLVAGCTETSGLQNTPEPNVDQRKLTKEQSALVTAAHTPTRLLVSLRQYSAIEDLNSSLADVVPMRILNSYLYLPETQSSFTVAYGESTNQISGATAAAIEYAASLEFFPVVAEQVRRDSVNVRVWAVVLEAPADVLLTWWKAHEVLVRQARVVSEGSILDPIRPDAPYPFDDTSRSVP